MAPVEDCPRSSICMQGVRHSPTHKPLRSNDKFINAKRPDLHKADPASGRNDLNN